MVSLIADGFVCSASSAASASSPPTLVPRHRHQAGSYAVNLLAQWSRPHCRPTPGGRCCEKKTGKGPELLVVILPEGGNDIYTKVKHFGDITMGVATQCLKS
ncbi:hypothetical protein K438DRAFT_296140 [Mycena galopus ATCC 62051]|nr:hypothetical protein K438DRAFT_296140 [Mycena galopus ATCC 62051]